LFKINLNIQLIFDKSKGNNSKKNNCILLKFNIWGKYLIFKLLFYENSESYDIILIVSYRDLVYLQKGKKE
jgi:hypothetical protein